LGSQRKTARQDKYNSRDSAPSPHTGLQDTPEEWEVRYGRTTSPLQAVHKKEKSPADLGVETAGLAEKPLD